MSDAQAAVDAILAGGIPAANVTESASRVFVTPAQKTAIETNTTAIAANTDAIATNTTAIATKAPQATTYTKSQTDAAIDAKAVSYITLLKYS